MLHPSLTVCRYSLLEAIRSRVFLSLIPVLLAVILLAQFIGEISVTETAENQSVIAAYVLRLAAVFITCLFVVSACHRELHEKTLDIILALPIGRFVYYVGKCSGFIILALLIAFLSSLPLLLYSEPANVLPWGLSLFCELIIMVTLSFAFGLALVNLTLSLVFVVGFYILARTITTIQLIAMSPVMESTSVYQEITSTLIDSLALLLPDLSRFTQSAWLVGHNPEGDVIYVITQTVIYAILLSAIALFDLYRKQL